MKQKNPLSAAVKALLSEKLPDGKTKELRNEGFKLKSPTRKAALAVAIYKKAENGDLSAIKELRSILAEETPHESGKTVVIIDDIGKKTL